MASNGTIEDGLREIVAEHGLLRLDIGLSNYSGGPSFIATAWWASLIEDGQECAFGRGQSVDAAVAEALTEAAARRAVVAEAA